VHAAILYSQWPPQILHPWAASVDFVEGPSLSEKARKKLHPIHVRTKAVAGDLSGSQSLEEANYAVVEVVAETVDSAARVNTLE
jgi:hypothetical protein